MKGAWQTVCGRTALQALAIVFASGVAAGATALWHPRAPSWFQQGGADLHGIELEALRALVQSEGEEPLWIDARSEADYARGHVEGALLLNEETWADQLWEHRDRLQDARRRLVVVYCDGQACQRSGDVAERLRGEMGLDRVKILRGDWRDW